MWASWWSCFLSFFSWIGAVEANGKRRSGGFLLKWRRSKVFEESFMKSWNFSLPSFLMNCDRAEFPTVQTHQRHLEINRNETDDNRRFHILRMPYFNHWIPHSPRSGVQHLPEFLQLMEVAAVFLVIFSCRKPRPREPSEHVLRQGFLWWLAQDQCWKPGGASDIGKSSCHSVVGPMHCLLQNLSLGQVER